MGFSGRDRSRAHGKDRDLLDEEWRRLNDAIPQERADLQDSIEQMHRGLPGMRPAEARPQVGAEPVKLDHALAGELSRIREQLGRQEEPVRRETLAGPVVSLAPEDEGPDEEEAASVVIWADVYGRRRNVHATLTGHRHHLAITAATFRGGSVFATMTLDGEYRERHWSHQPLSDDPLGSVPSRSSRITKTMVSHIRSPDRR